MMKNNKKSKISNKSWLMTLLLCTIGLFGWNGIHRFYVNKIWTGILMFITIGGLLIWWIIDMVHVYEQKFKDKKGNLIINEDLNN